MRHASIVWPGLLLFLLFVSFCGFGMSMLTVVRSLAIWQYLSSVGYGKIFQAVGGGTKKLQGSWSWRLSLGVAFSRSSMCLEHLLSKFLLPLGYALVRGKHFLEGETEAEPLPTHFSNKVGTKVGSLECWILKKHALPVHILTLIHHLESSFSTTFFREHWRAEDLIVFSSAISACEKVAQWEAGSRTSQVKCRRWMMSLTELLMGFTVCFYFDIYIYTHCKNNRFFCSYCWYYCIFW